MNLGTMAPAALFIVAACADGASPDVAYTVSDSAGVTIVESISPAWNDAQGWTVGPENTLEIGEASAEEPYVFSQIGGVLQLSDGRLVVADGGSSEIRFFDSDGRFLLAAGREGDGPGEYRVIESLGVGQGDSLWVYDFSLRRITSLAPDGSLLGTHTLGVELPTLGAVGRLPDGDFVMAQFWSSAVAEEGVLGLRRDPVAYARFSRRGEFVDTIAMLPGREVVLSDDGGRTVMGAPPFGHTSRHTLSGGRLYVGSQETFQIGVYRPNGALERLIRIPDMDLAITQEDLASEKNRRVQGVSSEDQPGLRTYLDEIETPKTKPAYLHLMVDDGDNLWASEYVPFTDAPERWFVFNRIGAWLGMVSMPEGFRPHRIADDWILGVRVDDLGVERVVRYRLRT